MSSLAPVLEAYFSQRLAQRGASPHTVAAYRDTWRLLLAYAQRVTGTEPSALSLGDLDVGVIGGFLEHLETERGNGAGTTNARLAAVHSLYRYAALRCPEHAGVIQRVLAIPTRRPGQRIVSFLSTDEVEALLAGPDLTTFFGRRDRLLMLVGVQTGLRVSELTGLTRNDVTLGVGAHVHCLGKGRKERDTPLTAQCAKALRAWMDERGIEPAEPVFTTRTGGALSTDAVEDLLDKYVKVATVSCPSLTTKRVTPHTLRHTCAMNLLQAGVDTATIALWLGHANIQATQVYLHADLALKEQALARTAPHPDARGRYRPPDSLIAFLEAL